VFGLRVLLKILFDFNIIAYLTVFATVARIGGPNVNIVDKCGKPRLIFAEMCKSRIFSVLWFSTLQIAEMGKSFPQKNVENVDKVDKQ
jgi:hypothetical protein